MMVVRLTGLLDSYTAGTRRLVIDVPAGATLDGVVRELDRRYPGLRFRIIDEQDRLRPHMRMFLDGIDTRRLDAFADAHAELMIVGALSGG